MASEIRVTSTLRYAKDQTAASLTGSFVADQVGNKFESGAQSIGTSEEVLVKNDVGTIGYCGIRNADTTNFVDFGASAGVYSIRLKPGEAAVLPWQKANVYALANTAACIVEYLLVET